VRFVHQIVVRDHCADQPDLQRARGIDAIAGQEQIHRVVPAKSLREAVFALQEDPFFRNAMGAELVDYYVHIKNAEIERFQSEVAEWEQREYFEMF